MDASRLKSALLLLSLTSLTLLPMGCMKVPPVKLACNASAPSIYPGGEESVTATPTDVTTKKNWDTLYSWSGTGVTGNGTTATVNTASLEPGDYTVKGDIKEGKKGKEGVTGSKKNQMNEVASCSADFTVKPFEPPTISCSADPSTVKPGETSTITATGVSPQNRPLTYSYSASAGSINGSGTTATLNTTGAPSGSITVTCNVQDDKGHTASSTTLVNVQAPPPPPAPKTQTLCTVDFNRDTRRPTRVDNEAKACLDQVALDLKQQADAKAVLVGESDAKEKAVTERQEKYAAKHKHAKVEDAAAQRAVNAKDYLVTEQGIDASRISVATGTTDGQTEENYLVPAGANFNADVPGTTPVDESTVKAQARKPLGAKHK